MNNPAWFWLRGFAWLTCILAGGYLRPGMYLLCGGRFRIEDAKRGDGAFPTRYIQENCHVLVPPELQ